MNEETNLAFLQQDSALPHTTTNNSMYYLHSIFGDRIIRRGFWPPCLPD